MGRPIQKRWFLTDDYDQGKIAITAKIKDQVSGEGVIIEQTGTRKYKVLVNGVIGDVFLVNKIASGDLDDGEGFVSIDLGGSVIRPASKIQQYSVSVFNTDGTISQYSWNKVGADVTMPVVNSTPTPPITTYTVTFAIGDGTLISGDLVQSVSEGASAIAPVITPASGFIHDGWDVLFDDIQSDLTVNAVYTPE